MKTAEVSLKGLRVKTGKKDQSPMTQLHLYVAEQLGGIPKNKTIDITKVGIGPKDVAKLEVKTKEWIKKQMPYATKKMIDTEYGWLNLGIGPRELKSVEKDGVAYIELPLFVKKPGLA